MMIAKSLVLFSLIACSTCVGKASIGELHSQASSLDPGYSLSISPSSNPIRLEQSLNISVRITVGDKEIGWESQKGNAVYHAVRAHLTHNGSEVDKTRFHRRLLNELLPDDPPEALSSSSIALTLAPHGSFTLTIDLNRLYQIKESGTYSVFVDRLDPVTKKTVRSNILPLNIGQ